MYNWLNIEYFIAEKLFRIEDILLKSKTSLLLQKLHILDDAIYLNSIYTIAL